MEDFIVLSGEGIHHDETGNDVKHFHSLRPKFRPVSHLFVSNKKVRAIVVGQKVKEEDTEGSDCPNGLDKANMFKILSHSSNLPSIFAPVKIEKNRENFAYRVDLCGI